MATDAAGRRYAKDDRLASRYEIRRFLGKGGMGEVYEAYDATLEATVALKTLPATASKHQEARFRREVMLARSVTHPNVCRVHDIAADATFYTMEFVDGVTLADLVATDAPLAKPAALRLLTQIAAGLEAIHQTGITHRDLKATNIMLTAAGGEIKIMDFGLARAPALERDRLSRPGAIMGTLRYLAPELLSGADAAPASDIWALGVIAYMLVSGRHPFQGTDEEVIRAIDAPVAPPLGAGDPGDDVWNRAILRCLARRPSDRFTSAAAFARLLTGEADTEPVERTMVWNPAAPRNPRFFRREALVNALTAAVAARSHPATVAVTGAPGVGKTQLVNEYTFDHFTAYNVIWWVRGASRETIEADFGLLAIEVGVASDDDDLATRVDAALRWLGTKDKWLIVIDGVDEPETVVRYLSAPRRGDLLLTSHNTAWRRFATIIEVDLFTPAEAVAFLADRCTADAQTADLAKELGFLPLALELAASYMDESGISPREYLSLFREHHQTFLLGYESHLEGIVRAWSAGIERANAAHEMASALLTYCAYFDTDAVPRELLGAFALGLRLSNLELVSIVSSLRRHGLLSSGDDGVRIHSLFRRALLDDCSESLLATLHESAAAALCKILSDEPYDLSNVPEVLLPHVIRVVNDAFTYEWTGAESRLLIALTYYFDRRGDFAAALTLIRRAHEFLSSAEEPRWTERALVATMFARELVRVDREREAAPIIDEALEMYRAHPGDATSAYINALAMKAMLHTNRGDFEEALHLYDEAMALQAESGELDRLRAMTFVNYGVILVDSGRIADGRARIEAGLAALTRLWGEEHVETADATAQFGRSYIFDDPHRAVQILHGVVRVDRKIRGDAHRDLGFHLTILGDALAATGDIPAAIKSYDEALHIAHASNAYISDVAIRALGGRAMALSVHSRTHAVRSAQEALRVARMLYGPDDLRVIEIRKLLASIKHRQ